jgi:hypothetical protein
MSNSEGVIVGYSAFAEFLRGEGFKYSRSTLTKIGSPAFSRELPPDQRLPIIGYSGPYPAARPSELRDWGWRRIRPVGRDPAPVEPASAPQEVQPVETAPVPPRKRGRPPKVRLAGEPDGSQKVRVEAATK